MQEMEARMDAFAKRKGTLAQGPAAVLKAYRDFDDIGKQQYLVYRYPQLQRDVDTRDQAMAGRFQRVGAVFAKFDTATSWFTPELLTVPQATMEKWIAETPALAPYRFTILDNYRQQAHVLDESGERLLSLASQFNRTPQAAYQELSTSDIKFPSVRLADGEDVLLSPGNYSALLESNLNQADRAKAAAAHEGAYGATANTYAALYNGIAQRNWFLAQARKFPSTLDAALDGNAVPRAVVQTLVDTTRAGTAPLQRPYYVYQYATCFASSAQLFDAMTRGPESQRKAATERYLTLLKSGGNDHPMAQLQKAGVDLSQRATVQAVVDQMDLLVTRMEAEAAKLR